MTTPVTLRGRAVTLLVKVIKANSSLEVSSVRDQTA